MKLKNKIALITGAAQGIGEATARLFYSEGAIVILTDIQEERVSSVAKTLGERATSYRLDVSKKEEWEKVRDQISNSYERIDVLFNNAGILGNELGLQDPENVSIESWKKVHEVNLDSMLLSFQSLLPLLKKSQAASIINMSSRSGRVGIPASAAYSSSKAAIINWTRSLALYCAQKKYPIRANSILPAAIRTPLWDSILKASGSYDKLISGIPLGRMGEATEVASSVLFLASDESRYMTGSEIVLDGGILAGSAATPEKK